MYSITTSILSFLFLSGFSLAAPASLARSDPRRGSVKPYRLYPRQGAPTPIPQAQVDSFDHSTHFAAVAYCSSETTKTWTCGEHCDANPEFRPSLVGGDGGDTPLCELSTSMPYAMLASETHGPRFTRGMITDIPCSLCRLRSYSEHCRRYTPRYRPLKS